MTDDEKPHESRSGWPDTPSAADGETGLAVSPAWRPPPRPPVAMRAPHGANWGRCKDNRRTDPSTHTASLKQAKPMIRYRSRSRVVCRILSESRRSETQAASRSVSRRHSSSALSKTARPRGSVSHRIRTSLAVYTLSPSQVFHAVRGSVSTPLPQWHSLEPPWLFSGATREFSRLGLGRPVARGRPESDGGYVLVGLSRKVIPIDTGRMEKPIAASIWIASSSTPCFKTNYASHNVGSGMLSWT